MLSKIFKLILQHKIMAGIGLCLIIGAGYFGYNQFFKQEISVNYITAAVEKGTLISSVSGAGQVSASNTIEIKSKVSGDALAVNAASSQPVSTSTLIARIDSREAKKAERDAYTALETARLELNKLLAPADEISIIQAEDALAAAKRNLEDLINPNESALSQAENSLITAQDSLTKLKFTQESGYQNGLDAKQKAKDNLEKSYEDGFNAIANGFLDLPTLITEIRDVLYSYEIAAGEVGQSNSWNISVLMNSILSVNYDNQDELKKFISAAESDYKAAREKYDENFKNYKNASRYSEKEVIVALLSETLETTRAIAEAVKSESNMLDYWVDYRSQNDLSVYGKVTAYQADLNSYTSKTNSHLSSLLSAQRSLEDCKDAIASAERNLAEIKQNYPLDLAAAERSAREKEEALAKLKNPEQYDIDAARTAVKEKELALEKLKAGADELDIRAKKIAVQQKQEALNTARQNLADYDIYAPFDGIMAEVNIVKGSSVSSGTVIGSLITTQKIAEISLNEIDVASIKIGQKAVLTFDAVPDLPATGKVVVIDTVGAVAQGVVSYKIKIAFDAQDDRIKPGMSVSVSIITDSKQDVLLAPLSAVKTSGGGSYAEILINGQPQKRTVTVGLSDDTTIEIVEGLAEGDQVITQTITSGSSQAAAAQNSQTTNPAQGMMRMLR